MKLGLVLSATDKMSRVIDQATKKSTKSLEKVTKHFSKMSTYALGAGTAIVGGSFALVKSTAAEAKQISLNAQKAGLAVESYQRLTHAAERFKIDSDTLTMSIARMSRMQVSAAQHNKKAEEAFKMAGVSIYGMNGKLKDANQIIMEVAEKFKNAPDGPKKAAIAMGLFGRSGFNLIPMLNKGKKGLEEFGNEAEKAGMVMSSKTVTAFSKFNRESFKMNESLKASKRSIAESLLPTFEDFMHKLALSSVNLKLFISEHKKLSNTILKVGIGLLVFGGTIKIIISVMKAYKATMAACKIMTILFSSQLDTLKLRIWYAQGALAKFNIQAKLMAFWSKIVAAAQWIWNTSLYGCPIVWIIAGIMAVIGAVVLMVKYWKPITAFFKKIWTSIKSGFKSFLTWITDVARKILSVILKPYEIVLRTIGKITGAKWATKAADFIANVKVDKTPKSIAALRTQSGNAVSNSSSVNNWGSSKINYSPTIHIGSGSEADKKSFADMLKAHERDINKIVDKRNYNKQRTSFTG